MTNDALLNLLDICDALNTAYEARTDLHALCQNETFMTAIDRASMNAAIYLLSSAILRLQTRRDDLRDQVAKALANVSEGATP